MASTFKSDFGKLLERRGLHLYHILPHLLSVNIIGPDEALDNMTWINITLGKNWREGGKSCFPVHQLFPHDWFTGFGTASHLGVLCDIPCIGVAKKLMQVDGLEKNDEHAVKVGQS